MTERLQRPAHRRSHRRRLRQKSRRRERIALENLSSWWPRLVESVCEIEPLAAWSASRSPSRWGRIYRVAEGELIALGFSFTEAQRIAALAARKFLESGSAGYRAMILFASAVARGRRGNAGILIYAVVLRIEQNRLRFAEFTNYSEAAKFAQLPDAEKEAVLLELAQE